MKMPFGKHKGDDVQDLPDDYVKWFATKTDIRGPVASAVQAEYRRRFGSLSPNATRDEEIAYLRDENRVLQDESEELWNENSLLRAEANALRKKIGVTKLDRVVGTAHTMDAARKIIEAGYRALCLKNHPDVGGDTRAMMAINAAVEALRDSVGGS